MSPENHIHSPESVAAGMNFTETELTLALPGESRAVLQENGAKTGTKRGYLQTVEFLGISKNCNSSENDVTSAPKAPVSKAQVVGWPPVRAYRKNAIKSCKLVKVAVDGAPYLRKVDLEIYQSYQELLTALEDMFSCLTIRNNLNERKIMDEMNGGEYVPTYEDKDGDWMMIGDVPWNMFVESCKRLRLMKSSEAIGLAPRTPSKCSSSSD
ncbi:auxin-responsive protein IAA1 [Mercurialis annua]|uniref:auxin-responsive protein IAA1 n=1 Tax=Mercurialis annua TaxID=3986 RepID=UPI00215ED05A|nr:auxin-responsive protein IAA1 [Mercurialis annua]